MRRAVLLAGLLAPLLAGCAKPPLKVCADPNNLPFSNAQGEGFENRIIELIAASLGRKVEYTWWAQRRGFARNTVGAGDCDVWPGVAAGLESLETTRPYYRSTYVFVSRAARGLKLSSFDDPELKRLTIGVQMIGDDASNTPPAHALARRGLVNNVRGFMLYGDYRRPNPPAAVVKAVDDGVVDTALVWGPLAGYFAAKADHPLSIQPVAAEVDDGRWPMAFDIAMGVRKGDEKLKDALDQAIQAEQPRIDAILKAYGVPKAPPATAVHPHSAG